MTAAAALRRVPRLIGAVIGAAALLTTGADVAVASSTKVDFGDISHKGMKNLGPASTGLKLSLELGMIANQQGIANAVKAASNPRRRAMASTRRSQPRSARRSPPPGSFVNITTGGNAVFGGVSCCTAGPGFDLASGLGSPLANLISGQLHH